MKLMGKETLKMELKADEGIVDHAYQDHLGFWTIGCGHLIDARKGGKISQKVIDILLEDDIDEKSKQVYDALPWVKELSDGRQRALINMCFQMGINGLLGFKNSLAALKSAQTPNEFSKAADMFLQSKWATQTPARAKRVTDMIRKG